LQANMPSVPVQQKELVPVLAALRRIVQNIDDL
jgi:hypothetical protein